MSQLSYSLSTSRFVEDLMYRSNGDHGVVWTPPHIKKRPTGLTVGTIFASGHGYTNNAGGSANLNDSSDFVLGSQCVSVVTDGAGTAKTIKKTGFTNIDMTGKYPIVVVKIPDTTHVAGLQLWLGDTALANAFKWEMKNSQATWYMQNGQWIVIPLSWGEATTGAGTPTRSTITAAQFRVVDDAGAPVSVSLGGWFYATEPSAAALTFTFDDGIKTQDTVARAYLDTYAFPATAFVIRDELRDFGGSSLRLSLADCQRLRDVNGWQIGAHDTGNDERVYTYTQLEQRILKQKTWLRSNGFDDRDYAYPGGEYGLLTDGSGFRVYDLVQKYYRSARTINQFSTETQPVGDPHKLRVMYVTNSVTTAAVSTAITKAVNNKEWLILVFHNIGAGTATTDYSVANFQTIVDAVATSGIAVRTVADQLSALGY